MSVQYEDIRLLFIGNITKDVIEMEVDEDVIEENTAAETAGKEVP